MSNPALTVETPSTGLSTIDREAFDLAARRKLTLLRPIAEPAEIIAVQNATRSFVHQALVDGRDYGLIPGTNKKTLLKPGAERVALAFGCYYGEPTIIEQEIDHNREVPWRKIKNIHEWKDGKKGRKIDEEVTEGISLGLYRYVVKVPLIHAESGRTIAVGIASCSTMESKYIDRPRDSENTVLKMGHKRGMIASCLIGFGLSDEFTQDLEDSPLATGEGAAPGRAPAPSRPAARAQTGGSAQHEASAQTPANPGEIVPECPACGGTMWDNRTNKRNPKAPDWKCRDRRCDGVIWTHAELVAHAAAVSKEAATRTTDPTPASTTTPSAPTATAPTTRAAANTPARATKDDERDLHPPLDEQRPMDDDDLPF